jgi:siroheme synthase
MMGLAHRADIARALVAAGWSRSTPAAIVCDASHPDEHVWRGTLDGLRRGERDMTRQAAGTIVIGEVVNVLTHAKSRNHHVTTSVEALCLS